MYYSLLFTLLREALWRSVEPIPPDLSSVETECLFTLAEQQAVSGLVIDAIIRHDVKIPQQWVFEAVGILEQIKQQSKAINEGAVQLNKLMSENGISYVIVKGQVVASKYPDPLLRQSGDIDYYCDSKYFPVSQEAIKKHWGIEPERKESDLHVHFDYQDVTYEGHFLLTSLYSKKRHRYWQQLLDNDGGDTVSIDGHDIKTLSATTHTLYVFIHLYSHLLALGVGLRQFCDLAVLLYYCKEQIDMDALRRHLCELGLERAYKACGCILVDQLGLSQENLGYTLSDLDRKYGEKILAVVMYRGNMGHYNKRGGFSGWKHKVEALGIKVSHFMKFMPLAPEYSRGWLWHEIVRQVK